MYAVGVYEMREGTLRALEENCETITSTSALLEATFSPIYELYGKLQRKEMPEYAIRDHFESIRQELLDECWFLDEDYDWAKFASGEMPEAAIEGDMAEGWSLFLDSYAGVNGYQPGDENNPFQIIDRSKASFVAIYFFFETGYLFVLRSPHIVGGTILPGVAVPEELEHAVIADPLRPNGGVPTCALPIHLADDANHYNDESEREEEREEEEE